MLRTNLLILISLFTVGMTTNSESTTFSLASLRCVSAATWNSTCRISGGRGRILEISRVAPCNGADQSAYNVSLYLASSQDFPLGPVGGLRCPFTIKYHVNGNAPAGQAYVVDTLDGNAVPSAPTAPPVVAPPPVVSAPTGPGADLSLYRLYNPKQNRHFYTISSAESAYLTLHGWTAEGRIGGLYSYPSARPGLVPLYRISIPATNDHVYSTSAAERDLILSKYGGVYEGLIGYVGSSPSIGAFAFSRFYNGDGGHFFTSNDSETSILKNPKTGWSFELITGYLY